ncbi:MAG: hypothetical protein M8350_08115 [Methanosarcinaceae archaeon]|nr:hypothetical protein [Methanosarcinaceae archaeon]
MISYYRYYRIKNTGYPGALYVSRVSSIKASRNYLQKSMTGECTISMNEEHGISPKKQ